MNTVPLPNLTLRQRAYGVIQSKLLSGELRAGDLVSELALAEQIGMSRTPVREAIGQLEMEGLFAKVPRVGTLVRLPEPRELAEMYDVREALESYVASIAVTVLTGNQLAELESYQTALLELVHEIENQKLEFLDEARLARFFEADIGFHSTIISATDNRHLVKIIGEFRVVQRVYEYGRMCYDRDLVLSAAREHGEVLQALKNNDGTKARDAMTLHIRSSCAHAMKQLATNDAPQPFARTLLSAENNKTSRAGLHSRLKQRPRRRAVAA